MDACAVILHGTNFSSHFDLLPDHVPRLLWDGLHLVKAFHSIAFCSIFLLIQPDSNHVTRLLNTLNQFEFGLMVMDGNAGPELNGLFSRNLVLIDSDGTMVPGHRKCPGSRFVEPIPLKERVHVFQKSLLRLQLDRGSLCPSSLKDRAIQVSILGLPPYVVPTSNGKTGVDVNLLGVLAQKLGFTYYFKEETAWQSVNPNGTVHGTIGSVHYNDSQIGIGHLIMDESAKKLIDQPRFLYDLSLLLIGPKPKPLPPILNTLRPFPTLLWGSICITVSISALVMASLYFSQERMSKEHRAVDVSVPLFWALASLVSQSSKMPSVKLSSFKLFLIFWMVFTCFISFSYECNLRANLIHIEYEEPVNSLQDLYDKKRQLFLVAGTSFQKILSQSIIPEERHFGKMVAQRGLEFQYTPDGLLPAYLETQVLQNGDSFLTGSRIGAMMFPRVRSILGTQPYRFGQKRVLAFYSGFCTPIGQPWSEDIRFVSGLMDQAGLALYQIRKFMPIEYLSHKDENRSVPIPFSLEHLASAMLVLVFGYILAFGSLTAELLLQRKRTKQTARHNGNELQYIE